LATLTGQPAPALGERLARQGDATPANPVTAVTALADMPLFAVSAVPAEVLGQRPDLYQAERAVVAAVADIGAAQADRYPRLTLNGSVATGQVRMGGQDTNAQTWSLGPLALTLPIFDAGRRAANVEAARARFDEAVSRYQAQARRAVQEVEQALLTLAAARGRSGDARAAAEGYRASFEATETRHRNGLASLVELEDARRNLLAAEITLVQLQRELQEGWIALYRAAGGGWQVATLAATPAATR
jgi:multidrug efflux system outer membrane protein